MGVATVVALTQVRNVWVLAAVPVVNPNDAL